jgi:hypothetical protein
MSSGARQDDDGIAAGRVATPESFQCRGAVDREGRLDRSACLLKEAARLDRRPEEKDDTVHVAVPLLDRQSAE